MIIEKNISPYIIFSEESISNALSKINSNKVGLVFCVSEHGIVEGVFTDGDFRRWVINTKNIDLGKSIALLFNRKFISAHQEDNHQEVESKFSEKTSIIPIIDNYNRLTAIAFKKLKEIVIGGISISEEHASFIIAEIGMNHNGNIELAKKLVDEAIQSGANCAKFQMRNMKSLYRNTGTKIGAGEDLGAQYVLDILSKFQLSNNEMFELFDYCKDKNIIPLCTPWDNDSLVLLEKYGMDAYKVASADMTNHELLALLINTKKPIIMSTGMSREEEIIESVELFKKYASPLITLHCNSTYPAPFKDVNLNYMDRLKEITGGVVGYSGHERGYSVAIAAVARGAKVIEKHFTLDKNMEGNDHKVSLLPFEFSDMVQGIREVEKSLGSKENRIISQGELMNRENLAKSLVSTKAIKKGEVIKKDNVDIKSPGRGLQPNKKEELIGLVATRDIDEGDFFYASDLKGEPVLARPYEFSRPWGIPVRYHDYKNMIVGTNPDFIEFHLSYKDMDLDYTQFFDEALDMDFLVHSPDLFEGDHLLNFASNDNEYRKRSICELQRVIDIARGLKKYFNKASEKTKIIVSLGGFSENRPLSYDKRKEMYSIVADSLSQLDTEGVEILPQTLPPFPWYFGGQLYCNLFVDADDTVEFCKNHAYRVCFDISHSKLAANHKKISFSDMVSKLAPISGHLHIVDAEGVDGEGIQIGEGEIDFSTLGGELNEHSPDISFIPEIWQGHKNNGEAFWLALEKLEKAFR
ncbi:N-acetylneuraminate synthase family protein [Oceanospirillaceae bacterium]|nr:N-acetylneuraminate synthase family protein [Oceanospirillaceae bacterium]